MAQGIRLSGGLVILNGAGAPARIIALQYNPDSLSRTLQVQALGDAQDRSDVMRLKAPAVETLKLEVEIDLADQLELPSQNPTATELGLHPHLAALETLVHPTSQQLQANEALASAGTLEIAPMEAALTLFVWSKNRVLPVRITEFSVTEEAFDGSLNPIRAKVSLGMRVLSVHDVGFAHKAGQLFMASLRQKEQFAARHRGGQLGQLGLNAVP